jgi:hypothetical protein
MSWQVRDGHQYFYLSRKRDGSRQTIYFGRGPVAQLAASGVAAEKLHRDQQRDELRMIKARMKGPDSLARKVDQGARMLLEARLLAEGFYHTHRQWRGKRRVRALSNAR